jgi:hypothetical protein
MAHQLKSGIAYEMLDIGLPPGEEVIEADDVVSLTDQAITEVGTEKSGTAGNEDTHGDCCLLVAVKEKRSFARLGNWFEETRGIRAIALAAVDALGSVAPVVFS